MKVENGEGFLYVLSSYTACVENASNGKRSDLAGMKSFGGSVGFRTIATTSKHKLFMKVVYCNAKQIILAPKSDSTMPLPIAKPSGTSVSPEGSVPSIAELSQTSSSVTADESANLEAISRNLFGGKWISPAFFENMENVQNKANMMGPGSEVSTTSTEATVVASKNLSRIDIGKQASYSRVGASGDSVPSDAFETQRPAEPPLPETTFTQEAPEDNMPSCSGALNLTPKQIAEIFLVFEGAKKMWPQSADDEPQSDASPSSDDTWQARSESLEKECAALKNIIQVDSSNLFNMRRAIEAQSNDILQRDLKIDGLIVEIQNLEQRLEAVKRERDLYAERQSELSKTVDILKKEVDIITRRQRKMMEDIAHHESANRNLIEENNIYAEKVADGEQKIAQLLMQLAEQKQNNSKRATRTVGTSTTPQGSPTKQEERLIEKDSPRRKGSLDVSEPGDSPGRSFGAVSSSGSPASIEDLGKVIMTIASRLENLEKKQREQAPASNLKLGRQNGSTDGDSNLRISQDPEAVEVLMAKSEKNEPARRGRTKLCCDTESCDAWSAISGTLE